jgi:hypothetical protein
MTRESVPLSAASPDEREQLVELSTLIVAPGRDVEASLVSELWMAVLGLRWTIKQDSNHPAREILRTQLETALRAAHFLRKCIEDVNFQRALGASNENAKIYDAHHDAFHGLGTLIAHTEKALGGIPNKQGRSRYAPGTNDPLQVCALLICSAWRNARGELPPHTSRAAQQACGTLWSLAGGAAQGHGGSHTSTGWRTNLARAKKDMAAGFRFEIERIFGPT